MHPAPPDRIGRYRIVREIGRGGMGVVYAARDERLDRDVALKLLHDTTRGDLLNEARAAARVSHPRFCQIFEVDTHGTQPFLVMELLTGETLARRLTRGPLDVDTAITTVLAMLDGLDALHGAGLVHRDLKPANVFLTPHGVKLVDFGLARAARTADAITRSSSLSGDVRGTPHYMSPEQARGEALDARTDIFSVGAVLFEAVTGQVPFRGATAVAVLNAVMNDHPPSIAGSPVLAALNRIIQRALARSPDQRFPNVRDMADALRGAQRFPKAEAVPVLRSELRVAVLPFRLLRPDTEIDFLALGLADAISHSIAQNDGCLVRSPFIAARIAQTLGDDLRRIGLDLDVDVLMSGTLLRSGDRVRVTAQLVECGSGRLMWSHAHEGPVNDVFTLQDEMVRVAMRALPVAVVGQAPDVALPAQQGVSTPQSPVAYRLFLRANQLARDPQTWRVARDLYVESLREDPDHAPAWAQLGRMHRIVTKYGTVTRGEQEAGYAAARTALSRALALEPDLAAAHYHFAQVEIDEGASVDALRRLLTLAARRPHDPELYAGLVLACRYTGLLDASLAAHEIAHRLDPTLPTSVIYTHWACGDYERVMAIPAGEHDRDIHIAALWMLGRQDEARRVARHGEGRDTGRPAPVLFALRRALALVLDGEIGRSVPYLEATVPLVVDEDDRAPALFPDGEATYLAARIWVKAGDPLRAARTLLTAVQQGYACVPCLRSDPWLRRLSGDAAFQAVLTEAEVRCAEARQVFAEHNGPALLGVTESDSWPNTKPPSSVVGS